MPAAYTSRLQSCSAGRQAGADGAVAHFTRAAEHEAGNTDYLFNTGYAHALAGDAAPGQAPGQ